MAARSATSPASKAHSPFTHLAPSPRPSIHLWPRWRTPSATGPAIYLVHGRLDWMFPGAVWRGKRKSTSAAGADVTYASSTIFSHCYPREMNAPILNWLAGKR